MEDMGLTLVAKSYLNISGLRAVAPHTISASNKGCYHIGASISKAITESTL